ncbi:hypothetical protein [Legionella sainthelensi]|uniref:hypothetical protein n=1 Tax=Legionella sainthelensi TaxID=28087 RepID=UPI000E20A268|nr:hypothetical protein [Legionella sainthelensi]
MKILYIPFTFEDSLFDLEAKASKWRKDYESKEKEVVVVYHDSNEIVQSEQVQAALKEGNCQIYILSHGINTPDLIVANQTKEDENYKELTIEEVARNFKSDLVIEGFSNSNVVKLFFCDEYAKKNKPRQMAEQFRTELGDSHQSMEIKYYSDVSIGLPGTGTDGLLSSKGAVRAFQMKSDLFCFNFSGVVGRARAFRQGLDVVEDTSTKYDFFKSVPKTVKYPKFSHPMLHHLARELVKMIQNDKFFSKNQSLIIDELLRSLPLDISDYLVDSITLNGKNMKFEMLINKSRLEEFLIKSGVIIEDKPITSTSESTKSKHGWIDETDYLGVLDTSFTAFNGASSFALTDYEEMLDSEDPLELKLSLI